MALKNRLTRPSPTVRHPLKRSILQSLQQIPGVGPSIAKDLWALGIRRVSDMKGKSPERLYERRCRQMGVRIDRCLLYVFRCAVYFASTPHPRPARLFWWRWTDPRLAKPARSG